MWQSAAPFFIPSFIPKANIFPRALLSFQHFMMKSVKDRLRFFLFLFFKLKNVSAIALVVLLFANVLQTRQRGHHEIIVGVAPIQISQAKVIKLCKVAFIPTKNRRGVCNTYSIQD